MTLRVILDTTAVAAYTHTSVHVGEVLAEIADEHASFGVPAVCLADVHRTAEGPQAAMLNALAYHTGCAVLPFDAGRWRQVGAAWAVLGDLGAACAAVPVLAGDGLYVLTADPERYDGLVPTIAV